ALKRLIGFCGSLLALCAIPACGVESAEDVPAKEPAVADVRDTRDATLGAAVFRSPRTPTSPFNPLSCATCHGESSSTAIFPGGSLAGATRRRSYWGGHEIELLSAINDCLSYFMLNDEPWTVDNPDAITVYRYLEALSGSDESAPFT